MDEKIIIFDTTLRDGEQSPGASLNIEEKLEIARQLERLKVDVLEAGFPSSSPHEVKAVELISRKIKGVAIAALSRAIRQDIEEAGRVLRPARHPRLHTFIATSRLHMKYKLKLEEKQVLDKVAWAVKLARNFVPEVEFSPEDATRTKKEFLYRVIEQAIKAGARVINIPDTVGYTIPEEFGRLIEDIFRHVQGIEKCILSVHCHNDLGLACANSLSALKSGARQIECTINGIGERAGNASLEEVVMALRTRKGIFKGIGTRINTEEIYKTSRLVSTLTGIPVQPNKAIVGANAFAHEAGIHQDGVIKKRTTYEIISPRSIGLKASRLILGKHSGRHAFKKKLEEWGYKLNKAQAEKTFRDFKALADKKKHIFDEDIQAIIEEELKIVPEVFRLEYLHVTTGSHTVPTATVKIGKEGKIIQEASCGDGPVDAIYKAIDKIVQIPVKLKDYSLKAVTGGKDAMGEVGVKIEDRTGKTISGRGISTDIIEASGRAYLNALNRLISRQGSLKR